MLQDLGSMLLDEVVVHRTKEAAIRHKPVTALSTGIIVGEECLVLLRSPLVDRQTRGQAVVILQLKLVVAQQVLNSHTICESFCTHATLKAPS